MPLTTSCHLCWPNVSSCPSRSVPLLLASIDNAELCQCQTKLCWPTKSAKSFLRSAQHSKPYVFVLSVEMSLQKLYISWKNILFYIQFQKHNTQVTKPNLLSLIYALQLSLSIVYIIMTSGLFLPSSLHKTKHSCKKCSQTPFL